MQCNKLPINFFDTYDGDRTHANYFTGEMTVTTCSR